MTTHSTAHRQGLFDFGLLGLPALYVHTFPCAALISKNGPFQPRAEWIAMTRYEHLSVGYAPSGTQTVWVSLITCSLFYTVSVQFVDT